MPIAKKICRVCGKTYEACRSAKRNVGVFHWQEVACSPECGTEYLRQVNEARNPVKQAPKPAYTAKHKVATLEEIPAPAIAEEEASNEEITTE